MYGLCARTSNVSGYTGNAWLKRFFKLHFVVTKRAKMYFVISSIFFFLSTPVINSDPESRERGHSKSLELSVVLNKKKDWLRTFQVDTEDLERGNWANYGRSKGLECGKYWLSLFFCRRSLLHRELHILIFKSTVHFCLWNLQKKKKKKEREKKHILMNVNEILQKNSRRGIQTIALFTDHNCLQILS